MGGPTVHAHTSRRLLIPLLPPLLLVLVLVGCYLLPGPAPGVQHVSRERQQRRGGKGQELVAPREPGGGALELE